MATNATMILELLEKTIGKPIPKPEGSEDFIVKEWRLRRGERALIYTIPNHKNPSKPHEKGVTSSEWEQAFERLQMSGEFTRQWFNQFMPDCAKEGDCNFTTIGGLFELLGLAEYTCHGVYIRKASQN
jgi:hypothetical protein